MYKVGDVVIYKRDVCKIQNIKEAGSGTRYYIMNPIDDLSLTIKIPVDGTFSLRYAITKEEVQDLISKIPSIETIEVADRNIEYEYKKLLADNSLESLIKIIKTTYLRNQMRIQQKKRIGEKDDYYLKRAEKRLYNELSVSLQLSFEETKQYVVDSVQALLA